MQEQTHFDVIIIIIIITFLNSVYILYNSGAVSLMLISGYVIKCVAHVGILSCLLILIPLFKYK